MTSFTVKQLVLPLLQAYFTVLEGILTKVKQVVLLLKAISLQLRETIRCQKTAVPAWWKLALLCPRTMGTGQSLAVEKEKTLLLNQVSGYND